MPDQSPDGFDWLESPEFMRLVEMQVVDSARRAGLRNVEDDAIARVAKWVSANRDGAREEERSRPVSQQRGPNDALHTVDRLVRLAAEVAMAAGHFTLREPDLMGVYLRHFCGSWPLCHFWGMGGGPSAESETVVVGGPTDILAYRIRDIARGGVHA